MQVALELLRNSRALKIRVPQYKRIEKSLLKLVVCMNACGQHNMSAIGFQGMSNNAGKLVSQHSSTLGVGSGNGRTFSDKVIKIPSRRGQTLCHIF
jgi:sulfite reductase (ferredoxin)